MMPSGHKAFLVSNVKDVELLLMHNKTYAAECVPPFHLFDPHTVEAIIPGRANADSRPVFRSLARQLTFGVIGSPTTFRRGSGSRSLPARSNYPSRSPTPRPRSRPRSKRVWEMGNGARSSTSFTCLGASWAVLQERSARFSRLRLSSNTPKLVNANAACSVKTWKRPQKVWLGAGRLRVLLRNDGVLGAGVWHSRSFRDLLSWCCPMLAILRRRAL